MVSGYIYVIPTVLIDILYILGPDSILIFTFQCKYICLKCINYFKQLALKLYLSCISYLPKVIVHRLVFVSLLNKG